MIFTIKPPNNILLIHIIVLIYPSFHDILNGLCSISSNKTLVNHSPFLLYTIKVLSGSLWEGELQQKTYDIYNEIKRLRNEVITYDGITKHLKEKGWTTTQGKELYPMYTYNLERRMDRRQKLLDRYKRTIENLRVEFHYDEEKENEKVEVKEKIKESKIE